MAKSQDMDRIVSLVFVRRGYDLLLLSNGLIGLCWLLQSPNRTFVAGAYRPLINLLDPVLPGYPMRWIGGLIVVLAATGYWALSSHRYKLGVYCEISIALIYFVLALSSFIGARRYSAGYSAGFIFLSFGFAHIQAAARNNPDLEGTDCCGDPDTHFPARRR